MKVKVENMTSPRGTIVSNQFVIRVDGMRIFQSYNSIIAIVDANGNISLDEKYWDYSRTTAKYRNIFLGETTKETSEKINSGVYNLKNLN